MVLGTADSLFIGLSVALSLVASYHGETRVDLLVAFLPTLMAPNPDADC